VNRVKEKNKFLELKKSLNQDGGCPLTDYLTANPVKVGWNHTKL
jgi:hypothetical protein